MKKDALDGIAARDPLGRALRADLTEEFYPLGIVLRLETNSPAILDAGRTAFGRYNEAGSVGCRSRFRIRLLEDPGFTELPPWPDPVFRSQETLFYLAIGSQNAAVADLERRFAFGFVAPAMARDAGHLRRTLLECLTFTMATHGPGATHTYVHASAVSRGNAGLIFSGPRESGKSTLAYACARRGFHVVTDDVIYLNQEANGVIAWGRPWQLRFLPDCVRLFPELQRYAQTPENSGSDVIGVEVEDVFPSQAQVRCEPAGLFFLERSGGSAACEPMKPGQAVELLARDMIQDAPAVMEKHLQLWWRLARRGSYLLRCGDKLEEAVVLLEHMVH